MSSSASSPALYVPVHRRSPTASVSSRTPSPSPSFTHHTLPTSPIRGVYTPGELLSLSTSPLAKLSAHDVDTLRALVPEVVQTRKQRKAMAWHAHHHRPAGEVVPRKRRSSHGSHAHTSESEEDRTTTWRRI